jgi:hypothetical protein
MEAEEFPMSREQKKDTHLKEVIKKSDKFSERLIERSTVITYDNKIYIYTNITQKEDSMVASYIHTPSRYNKNGSYTKTKSNLAQP